MKDVTLKPISATERIVECRCANCFAVFDGVVQHLEPIYQAWGPEYMPSVTAMGWLVRVHRDAERLYCSSRCVAVADMAKPVAGDVRTVQPVQKIADQSYQRNAARFQNAPAKR